ncbi:MAG: NADH dehydrogenase [Pelotomaculum sp. PtaB.Bin104]|nr:MAG: NADH dehydrogenase [Pelotomaculum sp. PtaB.Bin104]
MAEADKMLNEFWELSRRRHSIRKFTAEAIPDEALNQILETAQTAPSAGNLQAYEIVIVKEQNVKQMLASAALGQSFGGPSSCRTGFFRPTTNLSKSIR